MEARSLLRAIQHTVLVKLSRNGRVVQASHQANLCDRDRYLWWAWVSGPQEGKPEPNRYLTGYKGPKHKVASYPASHYQVMLLCIMERILLFDSQQILEETKYIIPPYGTNPSSGFCEELEQMQMCVILWTAATTIQCHSLFENWIFTS